MKTKPKTHSCYFSHSLLIAGFIAFAGAISAAPMDTITLAEFDFSDAQKTRTQALIDNGTLEIQRVLTAPETGYRHMGWPVATRLPDGRSVVLIRNLLNHSGYDSHPDNARRIIYSDDLTTWLPAGVLSAPPALGVNAAGDVASLGNYDYKGMHAISWDYPADSSTPRLVVVTGKHDTDDTTLTAGKLFRVYLSDDRGVTWREQIDALSAMPTGAVHSGPNMIRHPEFGLVVPFGQQTGSGTGRSNYLASSTNAGETWHVRIWDNTANSRSIEPALATWGPGHMVMIGRERTNAYGYDSASGKYYYTQHVYTHTPGAAFSDVSFTTARTNIAGNGKTPDSKGKNAYEAHDTAEVIYNPVTGRIEMIQSSRWGNGAEDPFPADPSNVDTVNNSLNIWSIDPVDLLAGETTWRFDGNIVERQGIILGGWDSSVYGEKGNKDGFHPGGSIVDEAAGKQHIFVYVGVYTQYASAYLISRPLDTYAYRAACGLPDLPKPAITGVSVSGNTATINGINFTALKEVLVAGQSAVVNSSNIVEIKVSLPSGVTTVTANDIVVRTDNGITTGITDISGFPPAIGAITYDFIWPGKPVTITGANLDKVAKVLFGDIEVTSFVSKNSTEIVLLVPEGVTNGNITIQTADGDSVPLPESGAYTVAIKPSGLAPLISTQPVVNGLHPVDFIASADGIPAPSYVWQHRNNDYSEWKDIIGDPDYEGIGTAHLVLLNTVGKHNWQIRYIATNGTEDANSNPVTLKVIGETFSAPSGIATSPELSTPDLYVADSRTHAIYVVTQSDQSVLVFAGQPGEPGFADGPSETARFNTPRGLALDADGRLIVADTGNSRIRAIAPDGTVTTLSTAFNQPRDVVAHHLTGDIYVADTGNHLIKKLAPDGTVTILAGAGVPGNAIGIGTAAQFNRPSGIAIDNVGNLYIADTGNNCIRLLDTATGNVTTFAGRPLVAAGGNDGAATSAATFRAPESVAVDDVTGEVLVADTGNHRIRVVTSGSVASVAGQGPGIAGFKDGDQSLNLTVGSGWLDSPSAIIAGDGIRTFYIADTGNAAIRRYGTVNIGGAVTGELRTLQVNILASNTGSPPVSPTPPVSQGGGAPTWFCLAALAALLAARPLLLGRR